MNRLNVICIKRFDVYNIFNICVGHYLNEFGDISLMPNKLKKRMYFDMTNRNDLSKITFLIPMHRFKNE